MERVNIGDVVMGGLMFTLTETYRFNDISSQ